MTAKRHGLLLIILCAVMALTACTPAREFGSAADERLYRSIEQGGEVTEIMESVAAGANIDRLKRGRLVNVNMVEFAVGSGRRDVAEWLIDNGADVNYKTSIMGETLLMSMAAAGEYDLCRLLLEKGADIGAKDRLSDTALEYVFKADGSISETELDRLVTLFLENGAKIRPETLTAAQNGYSGKGDGDCRYGLVRRVTVALRENGSAVKLRPAFESAITGDAAALSAGTTELSPQEREQVAYYAAAFGTGETLAALLDSGEYHANTADKDGNTLLMLAARYGNAETVRYLLDENVDFYAKNRFGKTALDLAWETGGIGVAVLLEANIPARNTAAFGTGVNCCCECCRCLQ